MVCTSGESVGLAHRVTGLMMKAEVKACKVKRLSGLVAVEFFGGHEVFKVFVVHPNFNLLIYTFKEVFPFSRAQIMVNISLS